MSDNITIENVAEIILQATKEDEKYEKEVEKDIMSVGYYMSQNGLFKNRKPLRRYSIFLSLGTIIS